MRPSILGPVLVIAGVAVGAVGAVSRGGHEVAPSPVAAPVDVVAPGPSVLGEQYVAAISDHYIPAKREAERTGNWYRPYEVARLITLSCTVRATWDQAQLQASIPEPAQLPGMEIDWRLKSISAARELTNCIQIVRSERAR